MTYSLGDIPRQDLQAMDEKTRFQLGMSQRPPLSAPFSPALSNAPRDRVTTHSPGLAVANSDHPVSSLPHTDHGKAVIAATIPGDGYRPPHQLLSFGALAPALTTRTLPVDPACDAWRVSEAVAENLCGLQQHASRSTRQMPR